MPLQVRTELCSRAVLRPPALGAAAPRAAQGEKRGEAAPLGPPGRAAVAALPAEPLCPRAGSATAGSRSSPC